MSGASAASGGSKPVSRSRLAWGGRALAVLRIRLRRLDLKKLPVQCTADLARNDLRVPCAGEVGDEEAVVAFVHLRAGSLSAARFSGAQCRRGRSNVACYDMLSRRSRRQRI